MFDCGFSSSKGRSRTWLIMTLVAGMCAGTPAFAQNADDPDPIELRQNPELDPLFGRPVQDVRLFSFTEDDPNTLRPMKPVLASLATNQIRTVRGMPYSPETAQEDVKTLSRLPQFGRIRVEVQPTGEGTVIVTYMVVEQPIIEDVQVVGNVVLSDGDVARVVGGLVGTPVDKFIISNLTRRIETAYQKKGYYRVQVLSDMEELAETGILYLKIRESMLLRVSDVRFSAVIGELSFTQRQLRSAIKTEVRGLFTRGYMDDDKLDGDIAALASFYRDRGYLDVNVGRRIREAPNGKEAIVEFDIDEGPVYTLGTVKLLYRDEELQHRPDDPLKQYFQSMYEAQQAMQPNEYLFRLSPNQVMLYRMGAFAPEQIAGHITVKSGDVFNETKINESEQIIKKAFYELGYTDVSIYQFRQRRTDEHVFDLLIDIQQGKKFKTGEVIIAGIPITRKDVVLDRLDVRPERPANRNDIDESIRKLTNTRIFSTDPDKQMALTFQPESETDPGYRDMLVEVSETQTGSFNFGAAVSSDSGVFGTITIKEDNFDITDTPDSFDELIDRKAFRGAGQTMELNILPGTQVQTYSLTFGEPRVFGSDYSFSTTMQYRDRQFSEYDENRYGGRFTVGRRFGSRWVGSVGLRTEWVGLSDIDPSSPVDFFEVEDTNLIDSLSFSLRRSSIDNPYVASKGNQLAFAVEQTGLLGGDFSYTRLSGEYDVYVPLHEDFFGRSTVFRFNTKANWIPQGEDAVPTYERFYLGGQSFRGFDFRAVSPIGIRNDTMTVGDEPVGGTWSFYAGMEVRQPIYEDFLALVGFIDTGTVSNDIGFDDYRVSAGFGLRLLYPGLSSVPLAFDFGFPILREDTDDLRLFTFSVDIPFGN